MNEAGLFFVSRCRLRNSGLVTLSPSAGFDPLRCALCDSSAEISLQPQQPLCGKVEEDSADNHHADHRQPK